MAARHTTARKIEITFGHLGLSMANQKHKIRYKKDKNTKTFLREINYKKLLCQLKTFVIIIYKRRCGIHLDFSDSSWRASLNPLCLA